MENNNRPFNPFADPKESDQSGLAARAHETLRAIFPEDFAPTPSNVFRATERTRAVAQLLHNACLGEAFDPKEQDQDNDILTALADSLRVLAGMAETQASVLWEVTTGPKGPDGESARALLPKDGLQR